MQTLPPFPPPSHASSPPLRLQQVPRTYPTGSSRPTGNPAWALRGEFGHAHVFDDHHKRDANTLSLSRPGCCSTAAKTTAPGTWQLPMRRTPKSALGFVPLTASRWEIIKPSLTVLHAWWSSSGSRRCNSLGSPHSLGKPVLSGIVHA